MPNIDFTKTTKQQNLQKTNVAQIYKELKQSGKLISRKRDLGRIALPPGKRMSINGKIYWETRVNRSDRRGFRT